MGLGLRVCIWEKEFQGLGLACSQFRHSEHAGVNPLEKRATPFLDPASCTYNGANSEGFGVMVQDLPNIIPKYATPPPVRTQPGVPIGCKRFCEVVVLELRAVPV